MTDGGYPMAFCIKHRVQVRPIAGEPLITFGYNGNGWVDFADAMSLFQAL